jgi:hypothetical protein
MDVLLDRVGWGGNDDHTHDIFSKVGIVYTSWYNALDITNLQETQKTLASKRKSLNVRFYDDKTWFREHKSVLRMYENHCNSFHGGDYSVSHISKVVDFLEYSLTNRSSTDRPGTLLNWIRKGIPVLERLAEWQGYTSLASGVHQHCEIKTIKAELERQIADQLDADMDYAQHSRHARKRMTTEEQSAMLQVIWGNGVHELAKIAMRASIEQALPSADARRGMDLRQIKLGMFTLTIAKRIKPVKCTVVGASLFRSKGARNKENQVGWIRSVDRQLCPVGALARYRACPGWVPPPHDGEMGLGG